MKVINCRWFTRISSVRSHCEAIIDQQKKNSQDVWSAFEGARELPFRLPPHTARKENRLQLSMYMKAGWRLLSFLLNEKSSTISQYIWPREAKRFKGLSDCSCQFHRLLSRPSSYAGFRPLPALSWKMLARK